MAVTLYQLSKRPSFSQLSLLRTFAQSGAINLVGVCGFRSAITLANFVM
jgi:hypothetical protein